MSSNQTPLRKTVMTSVLATTAIPAAFAGLEQPLFLTVPFAALLVVLATQMKKQDAPVTIAPDVSLFFQKGRTFSADGKMFYEVYSKFGDTEKGFVEFTLCTSGERKYGQQFCMTKSPSYQQAVCDFMAKHKLAEVRETAVKQAA